MLLDVSERLHVGGKGDSGLSLHYGFAWAFPCLTAGALGLPKLYRHYQKQVLGLLRCEVISLSLVDRKV